MLNVGKYLKFQTDYSGLNKKFGVSLRWTNKKGLLANAFSSKTLANVASCKSHSDQEPQTLKMLQRHLVGT